MTKQPATRLHRPPPPSKLQPLTPTPASTNRPRQTSRQHPPPGSPRHASGEASYDGHPSYSAPIIQQHHTTFLTSIPTLSQRLSFLCRRLFLSNISSPIRPNSPLLLPFARKLFYPCACGVLTVGFLVAASGNNSYDPPISSNARHPHYAIYALGILLSCLKKQC